jgi:ADP-ribosylglycohydrolase
MLIEIAIGDAYGAGFEYANPSPVRPNDLSRYVKHPRHGTDPGCYTEDTQMSLAVAETILEHGAEATAHQFTEKLVLAFKRDPREGYAARFWELARIADHKITERADLLPWNWHRPQTRLAA